MTECETVVQSSTKEGSAWILGKIYSGLLWNGFPKDVVDLHAFHACQCSGHTWVMWNYVNMSL